MILKKIKRSKRGVSNIISTLLITALMISSIAITYTYIMPTIEKAQLRSTIATSSLFLTKLDSSIQNMLYDGEGASRAMSIDAFSGNLEFKSIGLNVRAYIDGGMYLPLPSLTYGLAQLTIESDAAIMATNSFEYIKGDLYYPMAVTDEGSNDPAMILLTRTNGEQYDLRLWYRLLMHVHDTGDGGTIDVTIVVIQFNATQIIRGLSSKNYELKITKSHINVNPSIYGFPGNDDPITTSGDDFAISADRGYGAYYIYYSTGYRSNINFNLVLLNYDFEVMEIQ
ncbi:MAG: hypothetical protein ACTSO7_05475 [Candidatus Heimdallarchaeota archaeon]